MRVLQNPSPALCFTVGVIGTMDLDPAGASKAREALLDVLRFLRFGNGEVHRAHGRTGADAAFNTLSARFPQGWADLAHAPALDEWPGLHPDIAIVVLSSLAPGADSLAAALILNTPERVSELNVHFRAPLPFPADLYWGASTFQTEAQREDFVNDLTRLDPQVADAVKDRRKTPSAPPDPVLYESRDAFGLMLREDRELLNQTGQLAKVHERFAADLHNPAQRRHRYYAAGEQIAQYSDLLVALWDDDESQLKPSTRGTPAEKTVTERLIDAARLGLTQKSIPAAAHFGWHDCRPVIHIYAPRQREPEMPPVPQDKVGHLRILPPAKYLHHEGLHAARQQLLAHDAWQCPDSKLAPAYAQWHTTAHRTFCRSAHHLNAFAEARRQTLKPGEAEKKIVVEQQKDAESFEKRAKPLGIHSPSPACTELLATVDTLTTLRKPAALLSERFTENAQRFLRTLFWMAFFIALLLDSAPHLHPKKPEPSAAAAVTQTLHAEHADAKAAPEAETHAAGHETEDDFPRRAITGLALFLITGSFLYFTFKNAKRLDEAAHDARAIAEGLRVQKAWARAGLWQSIAAHYGGRHLDEMDWFKGLVRGITMPHQRFQSLFLRSTPAEQLALLQTVHQNWVQEQAGYQQKYHHKNEHPLHTGHKAAGILFSAGLGSAVVLMACGPEQPYHALAASGLAAGVLWLVPQLVLVWALFSTLGGNAVTLAQLIHDLVPSEKSHLLHWRSVGSKRWDIARSGLWHLPAGAALGGMGLCAVSLLAPLSWTPEGVDLALVQTTALLLGAGLCIAWTEKNLYSEHAYTAGTMAELFANGQVQLEAILAAMAETLKQQPPGWETRFHELRRQAQHLILELGRESLSENADWLILHRARPTEPVLPG